MNLTTAAIGLAFAAQLAQLAQWLSFGADVPRQIANAQLIFNVLGVALFIGFTPAIARGLSILVPHGNSERDRQDESETEDESDSEAHLNQRQQHSKR